MIILLTIYTTCLADGWNLSRRSIFLVHQPSFRITWLWNQWDYIYYQCHTLVFLLMYGLHKSKWNSNFIPFLLLRFRKSMFYISVLQSLPFRATLHKHKQIPGRFFPSPSYTEFQRDVLESRPTPRRVIKKVNTTKEPCNNRYAGHFKEYIHKWLLNQNCCNINNDPNRMCMYIVTSQSERSLIYWSREDNTIVKSRDVEL